MTDDEKYVTYRDLIKFQDKIFDAIDKRDIKVSGVIEAQISDVVGQLNVFGNAHEECRKEVEPVIRTHKTVKKLSRLLWTLLATNIGALVTVIFYFIRNGG